MTVRKGRNGGAGGRPTKLNPEVADLIIGYIEQGAPIDTAAAAAGISITTIRKWRRDGVRLAQAQDKGETIADKDLPFLEFSARCKSAEAQGEVSLVKGIRAAGEFVDDRGRRQWQAFAWLLERRHPERYARRTMSELSGPGGGPIEVSGSVGTAIENALKAVPQFIPDGDGEDDEAT
jgi:hypothetical protein